MSKPRQNRAEQGKEHSARLDAMRRRGPVLTMLQSTRHNQARRVKDEGEATMARTAQPGSLAALVPRFGAGSRTAD